ncbi:archease [Candidatus Berkelbacteria bacterium]|nr:archease [Candidatus Berkelbacteria bacterium]
MPHTTDLKVRATAKTLPELFVFAAAGMVGLMVADPKLLNREGEFSRTVTVKAIDTESLLVEWLTELLGIIDIENVYLEKYKITELGEQQLSAQLAGVRVDGFSTEIKAVPHDLEIEQTPQGYSVEIAFDA